FFPKPQDVQSTWKKSSNLVNFGYSEELRIFHLQGMEYRRSIYGKHCLLTKILYMIFLLFFIMVFFLLE
ncbi:hypothetical protein NEAUS05_2760, partial [Nematocida ausubeli]